MKRLAILLASLILLSSVAVGGVAAEANNSTVEDESDGPDIDTSQIERQVSHVQIHNVDWEGQTVTIDLTAQRDDTVQITDFSDGNIKWEDYDVMAGEPVSITYQLQNKHVDEVAFSVISAKSGKVLDNPMANPITFNRSAQWSDHWYSPSSAVGMTFFLVFYRYKRREYFSTTHLRSLLSGRSYRAQEIESTGRLARVKRFIVKHFYSPRSLLLLAIGVLLIEIATGAIVDRLASMQTELKLSLLVATMGIPGYWYIAGRILSLMPLTNQPKMLTLDNRENGGVDVLTGAKELFDDMKVKGADTLHKRPIAGTNDRLYVAHHYESASHAVVATWHQIQDAVAVAKNYTAAFVNYHLLETEIDEAREMKSAQPALRQKYQQEAQHVAMQRMDDVHFERDRSTNNVMSEVMTTIDKDEGEEETVSTDEVEDSETHESDSEASEGGDDE